MSHEVSFTVPERELGKAAVEFKVRHNGVIIGRLRVSKGAIEWIGRDKEIGHKLAWREFASLVQGARETGSVKIPKKPEHQRVLRPRVFRPQILQVLQNLGGSGESESVRVELKRRMTFNAFDEQPISATKPGETRWWNTAKWERSAMVKEGLLSANSPTGIWEITDAGRKAAATAI